MLSTIGNNNDVHEVEIYMLRAFQLMQKLDDFSEEDAANFAQLQARDIDDEILGLIIYDRHGFEGESLDLSNKNLNDDDIKVLIKHLNRSSCIRQLNLSNNQITDQGAIILAEYLRNHQLTGLDIQNNKIGAAGAKALALALEKHVSLKTLLMGYNHVTDEGAKQFGYMLRENKKLRLLALENNEISDAGASELAQGLNKNASLKGIYLAKNNIGDRGLAVLVRMLWHNERLQILDLQWNSFGVSGVNELAIMLGKNKTLTSLGIDANTIGDDGVKLIATALENNTSLRRISLGNNKVSDVGAGVIAKMLSNNSTLTHVNLDCNQIGDIGAVALANARTITGNTTLTTCNLNGNPISEEARHALQWAHDSISIYNYLKNSIERNLLINLINGTYRSDQLVLENFDHCNKYIVSLLKCVTRCSSIKKLDLSSLSLSEASVIEVLKFLSSNTTLSELKFGVMTSPIELNGVKAFADFLTNNKSINAIRLPTINEYIPTSVLMDSLKHNTSLKKLYFDCLSKVNAIDLCEMLRINNTLTLVDLSYYCDKGIRNIIPENFHANNTLTQLLFHGSRECEPLQAFLRRNREYATMRIAILYQLQRQRPDLYDQFADDMFPFLKDALPESMQNNVRNNAESQHHQISSNRKLWDSITSLEEYGKNLINQGEALKGQKVIDLASKIASDMEELHADKNIASEVEGRLNEYLPQAMRQMGEDRKLKDIIGHILLALTGIGLMVMLGKKVLLQDHSIFLTKTKRQKLLEDVGQEAKASLARYVR